MYRKHKREMESKTGIKTIDRLNEIPVVNAAVHNVTDYYGKVKDSNVLFRTSLNLAEMSVKTMAFAATPLTTLCKGPIESVDQFITKKIDDLEHTYPIVSKPTEQLANDLYVKTLKQPMEQINALTNFGTNTVNSVVKVGSDSIDSIRSYGYDQIHRSADLGVRMVDSVLENRFAKLFTEPVLSFTEKSLNNWFPQIESTSGEPHSTLRRIYDINNRVYRLLYEKTFQQLNQLHAQFETTIQKLKKVKEMIYMASMNNLNYFKEMLQKNTLVSQAVAIINKNNLSLGRLEDLARSYYTAILTDFLQMVEKYMALVKNFPVVFNGTQIRQTVDNLMKNINKESLLTYYSMTIDNLVQIHNALLSYTNQMFQVVNKSTQMLKRIPSQLKPKTNQQLENLNQRTTAQTATLATETSPTRLCNEQIEQTTPLTTQQQEEMTIETNDISSIEKLNKMMATQLHENLNILKENKEILNEQQELYQHAGSFIEIDEENEANEYCSEETTDDSSENTRDSSNQKSSEDQQEESSYQEEEEEEREEGELSSSRENSRITATSSD